MHHRPHRPLCRFLATMLAAAIPWTVPLTLGVPLLGLSACAKQERSKGFNEAD